MKREDGWVRPCLNINTIIIDNNFVDLVVIQCAWQFIIGYHSVATNNRLIFDYFIIIFQTVNQIVSIAGFRPLLLDQRISLLLLK